MTAAARIGVRTLLVATVLAASLAGSTTESARSGPADACRGAASGLTKVGALTTIIHTSVYVGGRYTGAAPCDLFASDEVRTDSRGEAVLGLAVRGQNTICAVFQRAQLTIYPSAKSDPTLPAQVVTFSAGRTWCSTKGSLKSLFTAARAKLLTRAATFGVEVDRGVVLVKVASGIVQVQGQAKTVTMKHDQAVLVSSTGKIKGPELARFDAKDALALARLR